MSDLSAFDFFRHETSNTDVVIRTDSMNKLIVVLALMPPEKVRLDMLQYLLTKMEDMDQVLLAISSTLGEFIPYIGGSTHAMLLIPLLEVLCNVEETTVRTAAAASVSQVLKTLEPENNQVARGFLDLFKRLSNDEMGEVFYGRISACQMLPQLYATLDDSSDRITIREFYSKLAVDELAIVRRAAALALIPLSTNAETEIRESDLLVLLKQFIADEHYAVKIIAIEALPAFAKLLFGTESFELLVGEIFPLIRGAVEDSSWRVRSAIALNFGDFANYYLSDETANLLFRSAINLCQDDESEVRINITPCLQAYCKPLGADAYLSGVIPLAAGGIEDGMPNVRKAMSDICGSAALVAGPEGLPSVQLSELVVKILIDEDPMVRVKILKYLPKYAQELPNLFTKLTPCIQSLFTENCWRIRVEVISAMPAALQYMGIEYFLDQFHTLFLITVKDQVGEVRLAAAECCKSMINSAGADWFVQHIFPSIKSMEKEPYHLRVTMLTALKSILSADALPETLQSEVLAMVLASAKDSVPNIRLRAAQVLGDFAKNASSDISRTQIRPSLTELQADKDKDVNYFATAATLSCA